MTSAPPPNSNPEISKAEFRWMIAAVIFGAIVRLSFPGRIAVEHFDEGVYASNFWFDAESGYSYPARHLYAPPLLPAAIEWTMTFASLLGIRPTGFIPMIPCLLTGIAMIPSLWWICRQWSGPVSGLIAAWLAATSDFHASYSRAALTDVPLCFFLVWAVHFFGISLVKLTSPDPVDSRRRAVKGAIPQPLPWREIGIAGVFTGLAWSTKYNGWLPLAIGFSGASLYQLIKPDSRRFVGRVVSGCVLIAGVAFAVWSPVLWELQKHGGYVSVMNNHRQYLVKPAGWVAAGLQQIQNISQYENPFDAIYRPFARQPRKSVDWNLWMFRQLIELGRWNWALTYARTAFFDSVVPLAFPILSLLISLGISVRGVLAADVPRRRIWCCLISSWFIGLTVTTPFYHPYPRLVLPWICSTWILLGMAAQMWSERTPDHRISPSLSAGEGVWKRARIIPIVLGVLLIIRLGCGSAHTWEDRTSIQRGATQFAKTIRTETASSGYPENEAFVYVLGEPALVFGLKAEGLPAVGPAQNMGFEDRPLLRPTFLAFPSRAVGFDRTRYQREDSYPEKPSHLVEFDNLGRPGMSPYETKLYRQYR